VKLRSAELGDYPYTVQCDAKPAGFEKNLSFSAKLGSMDAVETFVFCHYASKAVTYTGRIETAPGRKPPPVGDFVIESKEIKAAAADHSGVEVSVDIRFQPSAMGETWAMLVLSSADGGEYRTLLVGYTAAPQPQGPVQVDRSKPASIEFMNPFEEATVFSVQVDNPSFSIGSRQFRIDPKKTQTIAVQFKGEQPQGARLIVTAPKVTTPWIFFLKGI
jgi:hypothetical protein